MLYLNINHMEYISFWTRNFPPPQQFSSNSKGWTAKPHGWSAFIHFLTRYFVPQRKLWSRWRSKGSTPPSCGASTTTSPTARLASLLARKGASCSRFRGPARRLSTPTPWRRRSSVDRFLEGMRGGTFYRFFRTWSVWWRQPLAWYRESSISPREELEEIYLVFFSLLFFFCFFITLFFNMDDNYSSDYSLTPPDRKRYSRSGPSPPRRVSTRMGKEKQWWHSTNTEGQIRHENTNR